MLHLTTNADYLFLLKKISYFGLSNLKVGFAILLTKLKDFNKNIKCNLLV